jgi:hypothetical protein
MHTNPANSCPNQTTLATQDGLPFGHAVLRHIQSAAVANRADVMQLAFWWTNACHLRGFLQSLNLVMPQDEVRTRACGLGSGGAKA